MSALRWCPRISGHYQHVLSYSPSSVGLGSIALLLPHGTRPRYNANQVSTENKRALLDTPKKSSLEKPQIAAQMNSLYLLIYTRGDLNLNEFSIPLSWEYSDGLVVDSEQVVYVQRGRVLGCVHSFSSAHYTPDGVCLVSPVPSPTARSTAKIKQAARLRNSGYTNSDFSLPSQTKPGLNHHVNNL